MKDKRGEPAHLYKDCRRSNRNRAAVRNEYSGKKKQNKKNSSTQFVHVNARMENPRVCVSAY